MLLKKISAAILILTATLIPLAGCWDKRELNELAIVVAIGLDRDVQTDQVRLTLQVIRPSALNRQQGGSQESPYDVINASGRNLVEAIKKANMKLDRKLCFSHLAIIVAGEQAARHGLSDLIDFVLRTHEVRQMTWLAVTRDEVSQVLAVKSGIENVQAAYMAGIIRTQYEFLNVTASDVKSFVDKMPGNGVNPVVGVFSIQDEESISAPNNEPIKKKGLVFAGTAAFRKDRLKGYLNNKETRGLNYIINAQKGGHILVPALEDKQAFLTIEFKKISCKVEPVLSGGKPSFNIHVDAEGNISEVDDASDVSNPKELEKINREFSRSIRKDVRAAVIRSQKDLKTDILGFGRSFEEKYPAEWKKMKSQWTELFPDLPYKVTVKAEIKQTDMLLKPLETK